MADAFLATTPVPDVLPADYLARIHPVLAFRTYRCTACGQTQPDAGQSACLYCGTFWSLEPVWPQEEDL
jgi:hypothetical protein